MVAVIICLVAQAWKLGVAVGVALLVLCAAKFAVVFCMQQDTSSADNPRESSSDITD